jgi:hypothetical protein
MTKEMRKVPDRPGSAGPMRSNGTDRHHAGLIRARPEKSGMQRDQDTIRPVKL